MSTLLPVDRSGAKVIESLLCDDKFQRQYMDIVDIPEVVASTSWYLWWQQREIVRGEQVQTLVCTAMAIQALAMSFVHAVGKVSPLPRQNAWRKPLSGMQVLNVDASFATNIIVALVEWWYVIIKEDS
jgi:hypothetical protein